MPYIAAGLFLFFVFSSVFRVRDYRSRADTWWKIIKFIGFLSLVTLIVIIAAFDAHKWTVGAIAIGVLLFLGKTFRLASKRFAYIFDHAGTQNFTFSAMNGRYSTRTRAAISAVKKAAE